MDHVFSLPYSHSELGRNVDVKYLSSLYDSISLEPIKMDFGSSPNGTMRSYRSGDESHRQSMDSEFIGMTSEAAEFLKETQKGIRDAEDLMRSLAPFTHSFQLTGIDTNISLDLVSFMFETVYIHFLDLVKDLLGTLNKEMSVTFAALDIVHYCICSSIFLGLYEQMTEFSRVLLKFKRTFAPENGEADALGVSQFIGDIRRHAKSITRDNYTESWFEKIQGVSDATTLEHISMIQALINQVKNEIQKLGTAHATNAAVSKIEKRAKVLEENSFFVREGDLIKENRSGGFKLYRFFLFSDYLMYAHQGFFGEFIIHTKLSLLSLSLTDVENDEKASQYSFRINHPGKSFTVIADSPFSKYMWVKDIQQTISSCKARARLQLEKAEATDNIIERIEEQIEQQRSEVRKRSILLSDRLVSQRYIAQHLPHLSSEDLAELTNSTFDPDTGKSIIDSVMESDSLAFLNETDAETAG